MLDALGFATDVARYRQPPDEEDVLFARSETVAALRPIAEAVLVAPHARWWNDPVDLTQQRIAIPLTAHSGATVLAGWDPDATFRLRDETLTVENDAAEWRYSRVDDAWTPDRVRSG